MPNEQGGEKWNKWEIVAVAAVVVTTGLVVGLYRSGPFKSSNRPTLAAVPTTVASKPPVTQPASSVTPTTAATNAAGPTTTTPTTAVPRIVIFTKPKS